MKIDLMTGLLSPAQQLLSPHYNDRAQGSIINMLVIHNISLPPGQFGNGCIEKFFCGDLVADEHPYFETIKDLKVSAHLLINRRGGVVQFVPFQKRAWHAGVSTFQGQENCNDFSIGIELEGTDTLPYESEQYQTLAAVIAALLKAYPAITRERIVGHSDIAPGRKTDPGSSFDWAQLDRLSIVC